MILALLVSSALSAPVPTMTPCGGWPLAWGGYDPYESCTPEPTKTPVHIEVLLESWESNARAAIAWDELQRKQRAGLVFIITATATVGPTDGQLRKRVLDLVNTIESDKKKVGSWNYQDEEQSQWLKTWWAKPTATKTPNAEATCVARGHDWERPEHYFNTICFTYPGVFTRQAHGDTSKEIQCCRRCGLWRETP